MELRVLRYFITIAEEGSISKAAEKLMITQPTLSRQLKDLEQELGEPLFIREHIKSLNKENQGISSGFFYLCDFKSVSLRRCETNKPPAMICPLSSRQVKYLKKCLFLKVSRTK